MARSKQGAGHYARLHERRKMPGNCGRCAVPSDRATPEHPNMVCSRCFEQLRKLKQARAEKARMVLPTAKQEVAIAVAKALREVEQIKAEIKRTRNAFKRMERFAGMAFRRGVFAGTAKERKRFIEARTEWEALRGQQLHTDGCGVDFEDHKRMNHRFQSVGGLQ